MNCALAVLPRRGPLCEEGNHCPVQARLILTRLAFDQSSDIGWDVADGNRFHESIVALCIMMMQDLRPSWACLILRVDVFYGSHAEKSCLLRRRDLESSGESGDGRGGR